MQFTLEKAVFDAWINTSSNDKTFDNVNVMRNEY